MYFDGPDQCLTYLSNILKMFVSSLLAQSREQSHCFALRVSFETHVCILHSKVMGLEQIPDVLPRLRNIQLA